MNELIVVFLLILCQTWDKMIKQYKQLELLIFIE